VHPTVTSVFPNNKGFPHFGLSQFLKKEQILLYFRNSQRLQVWQAAVVYQSPSYNRMSKKSERGPGLGVLPKFCGSPLIFLQQLRVTTSNLVCCLRLPRAIIKLHPEKKWAWPLARGVPQNLGFPLIFLQLLKVATSRLAGRWVLPRPITESHPKEKVGVVMG